MVLPHLLRGQSPAHLLLCYVPTASKAAVLPLNEVAYKLWLYTSGPTYVSESNGPQASSSDLASPIS